MTSTKITHRETVVEVSSHNGKGMGVLRSIAVEKLPKVDDGVDADP